VTNALKHSRATKIRISLQSNRERTELTVSDNGQGFPPSPANGHGLGMHAMKYRADVIGAELHIQSGPGKGASITCMVRKKR
jgi:signal transduction histidine kinase